MSGFDHENSIRLVTEQGYTASPNAFVCCDIGYVKVDVLSNIFWGNTTLAILHQLKHPSHIKIA